MDNNSIVDKLKGREVNVINKVYAKSDTEPILTGIILNITPYANIEIARWNIPFVGTKTGIIEIKDLEGKILYSNNAIYQQKTSLGTEEEKNKLRKQGEFYI